MDPSCNESTWEGDPFPLSDQQQLEQHMQQQHPQTCKMLQGNGASKPFKQEVTTRERETNRDLGRGERRRQAEETESRLEHGPDIAGMKQDSALPPSTNSAS